MVAGRHSISPRRWATNDEDRYLYVIDVFDNGRVMLDVTAQEREQVQFAGEMVLDE